MARLHFSGWREDVTALSVGKTRSGGCDLPAGPERVIESGPLGGME